jgi:hypothetical protein
MDFNDSGSDSSSIESADSFNLETEASRHET